MGAAVGQAPRALSRSSSTTISRPVTQQHGHTDCDSSTVHEKGARPGAGTVLSRSMSVGDAVPAAAKGQSSMHRNRLDAAHQRIIKRKLYPPPRVKDSTGLQPASKNSPGIMRDGARHLPEKQQQLHRNTHIPYVPVVRRFHPHGGGIWDYQNEPRSIAGSGKVGTGGFSRPVTPTIASHTAAGLNGPMIPTTAFTSGSGGLRSNFSPGSSF